MPESKRETASQIIQDRVRKFSRVEKVFYASIIFTAIVLAVSVVFMQTKLLQVQYDLTQLNIQVEAKQTELDDAKQEVNELTRSERLSQLASSQDLTIRDGNLKTAE